MGIGACVILLLSFNQLNQGDYLMVTIAWNDKRPEN